MNVTIKRIVITATLLCGLATISLAAQQPMLLGMIPVTGKPDNVTQDILLPLYEKTAATAIIVQGIVNQIETENKADNTFTYTYDFSAFDAQPFLKSKKTKICRIDRGDCKIRNSRDVPNSLHPPTLEDCALALAQHANSKGITIFWVSIKGYQPMGSTYWDLYIEDLTQMYKGIKAASPKNIVIAGGAGSTEKSAKDFYSYGGKDLFDWLAVPGTTVIANLAAIHQVLCENGDGHKKIFMGPWLISGYDPKKNVTDHIREFISAGYQTLTTKTDTYDPTWVAGILYYPMNDHLIWDGKDFPQPGKCLSGGGLVDHKGKPKEDLLDVIFTSRSK